MSPFSCGTRFTNQRRMTSRDLYGDYAVGFCTAEWNGIGSGTFADNSRNSIAEAPRVTLLGDGKRLEIRDFGSSTYGPSIRQGVFTSPKSLDAPEPLIMSRRIAKLFVMVNGAPNFTEPRRVVAGVSELLVQVFGERGIHARSAARAVPSMWRRCHSAHASKLT